MSQRAAFLRPSSLPTAHQAVAGSGFLPYAPQTAGVPATGKVHWLSRALAALGRWNPINLILRFCRWIAGRGIIGRFITWLQTKVSPAAWSLVKDAAARGAIAGVGGAGSALVQKFMETKDGKWDRALGGGALPQTGMFQGGTVVPVQNKAVSSFGYGAQATAPAYATHSEGFPFGN